MKNFLMKSCFVAIIFAVLFALTGCGGDKLVGTQEMDGMTSTIEVTFKKDVADKIKMTFECKSTDDAKDAYESMKDEYKNAKVKRSGKKVIIEMKADEFMKEAGITEKSEMTKENFEKLFKLIGYEIKN